MDDRRLPKIASDFRQNHQRFKSEWYNDAKSWLNHWGIKEVIVQNTDDIKNIVQAKFKEKLWCDQELESK
jgi:hypothetical protein